MFRPIVFAVATLLSTAAFAQAPVAVVRGTITAVGDDGASLTFTSRAGESVTVRITPKTRFVEVVRASRDDLKPDSFIGIAAVPDKGDTLKALEVHIFPEAMRGTGEGFRPFDLAPKSSMTNGALNTRVGGVDGDELTVTYKGGEKKIRLPADAPIVALAPGAKAILKPGAAAIVRGVKAEDGTIDAGAVLIGKDGLIPPM